jgi:site-specific recombinase XerD
VTHDPAASTCLNRGISARSTRRRITKLLRRAGVTKPVRVHGFRHTYATAAVAKGASLPALRRLLGHSSLSTTQRYVDHLGLDTLLAAAPTLEQQLEPTACDLGVLS